MEVKDKLSKNQQSVFLYQLLGFSVDEQGVIYDEDGDQFYGYDENISCNLNTLEDIVNFIKFLSKQDGIRHAQRQMKSALGL